MPGDIMTDSSLNSVKSLILIRGLPGSGKSALAALLSEDGTYPVYSIDSYFTDASNGEYRFEYRENHLAYKQCESNTRNSLRCGETKVFVDNTFTLEWELEPYFALAAEFGYRVYTVTVENRHGSRNIHSVSEEQIRKMASKYRVVLYPESGQFRSDDDSC